MAGCGIPAYRGAMSTTRSTAGSRAGSQHGGTPPQARKDFHHDPDRFADFTRRYEAELDATGRPGDAGDPGEPDDGGAPAVDALLERWEASCKDGTKDLVLLYAARDPEVNHAVVLRRFLQEKVSSS